jgi:hypothetical protein
MSMMGTLGVGGVLYDDTHVYVLCHVDSCTA